MTIFLLQKPLGDLLAKIPVLADNHFSSQAKGESETLHFEREKELILLRDSVAAHKERELYWREFTQQTFNFMQDVILTRVDGIEANLTEAEQTIMAEIRAMKQSINLLSHKIGNGGESRKTQEILLDRIGRE